MDTVASDKIAGFVVQNHQEFCTVQARAREFKWCRSICEGDARQDSRCNIRYAPTNVVKDKHDLSKILSHPHKGDVSKFYVVGYDSKAGWIKLIRFVVVRDGDVNVEAVFIKKDDKKDDGGFLGFGYRYEHPEDFPVGQPGADNHAYFHVQPIQKTHDGIELPSRPSWLPDNFPTFFMFAAQSYEVAVYAIHSMVGVEKIAKLYRESVGWNGGFFMDRLIRLREASREPFPSVKTE
ncbi:hypothetical protein SAMN04244572_03715 [Azotobacter beijerinckii]|uniref:Uncharacterized protein n=1 Tax=Azotobacter beijerinckii TaxID=170623 RepID=A0A1H6YBI0_9GAMM|nr:hypothetical protein [Azotobacter beijerinckii]SEJ37234.1 hypothetical protein SAMN04244572_03715 [Azotobacter beijerinckii]